MLNKKQSEINGEIPSEATHSCLRFIIAKNFNYFISEFNNDRKAVLVDNRNPHRGKVKILNSDGIFFEPSSGNEIGTMVMASKKVLEEKLNQYMVSVYNQYNKIKFLDRELKHDELFVNLHIAYKGREKEFEFLTAPEQESENENKEIQKRIYDFNHLIKTNDTCVLIGESGAGKTTIVRNILLTLTNDFSTTEYVPVFIEMSKLSETKSTVEKFVSEKLGVDAVLAFGKNKPLSLYKLLLIFDGMDEVSSSDQLDEIIYDIEHFVQNFTYTKLIFTSRPSCEKIRHTNTFSVSGKEIKKYDVEELTDSERKEQIEKIIKATTANFDTDKFWTDLSNFEINNPRMEDMTKNPLLLSIILSVYQDYSGNFPKNKIELYDKASLIIQNRSRATCLLSSELHDIVELLLGKIPFHCMKIFLLEILMWRESFSPLLNTL